MKKTEVTIERLVNDKISKDLKATITGIDHQASTQVEKSAGGEKTEANEQEAWGVVKSEPSLNNDAARLVPERSSFVNFRGNLIDSWVVSRIIPSKLIEVTEHNVILDCLEDFTTNEHRERTFARRLFDGYITFKYGMIIIITQNERPGKIVFEFEEAMSGHDFSEFFEIDIDFEDPLVTGNPLK